MPGQITRNYRLISADGHFNEPGDLWTTRVPAHLRARAPRIESFELGDAWVLEGVAQPLPFGWGACAGRDPADLGPWARMQDINPGSYDPKARVQEMDADDIDAEVLFPSGGPSRAITANRDVEYHHAMVRAYNDWVSEFCSYAPERLGGVALLPSRGVKEAVAEVERVEKMRGFVAYLLQCYPHGDTELKPEDDPLWAALQATGKPLTIHVGLVNEMPAPLQVKTLPGTVHFYDAPKRMLEFIFGGVLDRFPKLTIVMTEVDMGWMPYFSEQADDNYMRHSKSSLRDTPLPRRPSEYMAQHFPGTFITDRYAIANRHRIGVERMLWSNDYPHITSDWPYSWRTINAAFADVSPAERQLILAGNAQRIFGFGR
jgi:predicted TIM-barrel fold metal-dependent hydrolase